MLKLFSLDASMNDLITCCYFRLFSMAILTQRRQHISDSRGQMHEFLLGGWGSETAKGREGSLQYETLKPGLQDDSLQQLSS